ncbi:unnamed protein product [Alopecurus aequalis]
MRAPASLPHRTAIDESSSSLAPEQQAAPVAMAVDSNMVVILASLMCAAVCILGLALVSRCACRRRRTSSSSDHSPPPKGLKKKAIAALPKVAFAASPPGSSSSATPVAPSSSASECAICLTEFIEGESLRVLPLCGHGFHVACIDAWLQTHATCPTCRATVVAVEPAKPPLATTTVVIVVEGGCSRCGRCSEVAAPASGVDTTSFLP